MKVGTSADTAAIRQREMIPITLAVSSVCTHVGGNDDASPDSKTKNLYWFHFLSNNTRSFI